eukprot:gnl/Chilomastix_caulleri/1144.p1 GENE.gnl/Chilomastix_caulleri/1144~~gnl/Chilomastix_caulleri/1144.p1  ORF type:complete len:117 (+),score=35.25 gnl/Chilomastix_caulleri/1144:147-497(+)
MSAELDPKARKVIEGYQMLARTAQMNRQKVFELEAQVRDYGRVISALNDLDGDRNAYRLIGDTLVKMTVKDASGSIQMTYDSLKKMLEESVVEMKRVETELTEYQAKNNMKYKEGP